MADKTKSDRVTLEELIVSTLAMTDTLAKADDRERRQHRGGVQSPVERGAGKLYGRAKTVALTLDVWRFSSLESVRG
jgi:hypothetical protein